MQTGQTSSFWGGVGPMRGKRPLHWLLLFFGGYALVWLPLEGGLWSVVGMGVLSTAVLLAYAAPKVGWLAREGRLRWGAYPLLGLLFGLLCGLSTLFWMVMKTGLHGHGPEFSPAEIAWVLGQMPVWVVAGGLAGLGWGLVRRGWQLRP